MNRLLVLLFLCFISFSVSSQESLEALGTNPKLNRENPISANRTIDKNYVYAIDTLKLPFKDDFSGDLFKKFNAQPTDANVSDTLFHSILNGGIPDIDTAAYMFDTTYHYVLTPVAPFPDSFLIDTFPIPDLGTRTICDLDAYPVTCITVTVWPAYFTDDTIGTPANPDNIYNVTSPDAVQDSALVYFVAATDTFSLWQDNFAYLNSDYGINPPTIGVVTFDGLDENGYPYDFSTQFTYGKADYLTSKPMFLGNFGLVDSLYLSFYYQAEGLGNEPEVEDSLVLQFWSPSNNSWYSIWNAAGEPLDTTFKQKNIKIEDTKFLEDGFKFRFLNYSSLSGSFDHWNLDYVFLNDIRTFDDTVRDDVAFQYPTHSIIRDYISMPWRHYKWNAASLMRDSVYGYQRNNNQAGRLIGGNNMVISYEGAVKTTISNPSTPSISGFTDFSTLFLISSPFFLDTSVNDTCAFFDVQLSHNTTPDRLRTNDTIRFQQIFADYYAYDDGTAEAAYGVQGLGALNPEVAVQFDLFQPDSIKSVRIHFSPSAVNVSSTNFILTIWADNGGNPGSILYQNIGTNVPRYNIGVNGFYEYMFDTPYLLPAGKYYVGWVQTTSDRINVGFDKNINSNDYTFYNSNGNWRKTTFEGTLMVRPSFVFEKDNLVSVEENELEKIKLYPNPANNVINISDLENISDYQIAIFDMTGKLMFEGNESTKIDISLFNEGVYLVKLYNKSSGSSKVAKFVKSN